MQVLRLIGTALTLSFAVSHALLAEDVVALDTTVQANADLNQQYNEAEALRLGSGTEQDVTESIRRHIILAEQGFVKSMIRLGSTYQFGKEAPRDLGKAIRYYQAAADAGYTGALTQLARSLIRASRYEEALAAYQQAVTKGVENAELDLAIAHLSGGLGQFSDYSSGFGTTISYADDGNVQAKYAIADAYYSGRAVEKNRVRSFELFKELADSGEARAMRILGQYYRDGTGVTPDVNRAKELFRKAIDAGQGYAMIALAEVQIQNKELAAAQRTLEAAVADGVFGAELDLAQAHYEKRFGEYSDKASGARTIIQLAEGGDIRAGRAALLYHERKSRRLNDMDLQKVLKNMTRGMEDGDGWATEALMRFYRNLSWLFPDSKSHRAAILETYGHQMRLNRLFAEQLRQAYDRNDPIGSRPVLADMIQAASDSDFYEGLLETRYIDRNVFTYILQRELEKAGYYKGRPTGIMDAGTLRAALRLCKDDDRYQVCLHGPLLNAAAQVLATGLVARR